MGRPLRVGIQLPEVEREVRWPEYRAIARAAETSGFDSIWVGDHLLYRGDGSAEQGPWEAWTLLAGLATVTERVQLGPLVACTAFHPPAVLAKTAVTVDEISGGRLVLALGAGWNRAEFEAFGLPFDHRASRFEEAFAVVRGLVSGEHVSVYGRWSHVEDAVLLPAPARRPTLMVGSSGPRILRATLPHVDAWNTWFDLYGNTAEGFARESGRVSAIATKLGRDPGEIARSACVFVVLDPDTRERAVPEGMAPVGPGIPDIARHLRTLGDAGADEAILVVDPITEASARELRGVLDLLDEPRFGR